MNQGFKSLLCLALYFLLLIVGCSADDSSTEQPPMVALEYMVGFVHITGNELYIDRVEIEINEFVKNMFESYSSFDYSPFDDVIFSPDLESPNGYEIHHPHRSLEKNVFSFTITDETIFTFTDFHLQFIEELDGETNRLFTTNSVEKFMMFFEINGRPTIPYFITVRDGMVVSFLEVFLFTI